MKRKYPKTQGYYVYSHSIDGIIYFGVSKRQPRYRWRKIHYKGMALEPYLDRWDEMVHTVIRDGLSSKEEALKLEDELIVGNPNCINKKRSGLIASNKKEYDKKRNSTTERKEYMKQYMREYRNKQKQTSIQI